MSKLTYHPYNTRTSVNLRRASNDEDLVGQNKKTTSIVFSNQFDIKKTSNTDQFDITVYPNTDVPEVRLSSRVLTQRGSVLTRGLEETPRDLGGGDSIPSFNVITDTTAKDERDNSKTLYRGNLIDGSDPLTLINEQINNNSNDYNKLLKKFDTLSNNFAKLQQRNIELSDFNMNLNEMNARLTNDNYTLDFNLQQKIDECNIINDKLKSITSIINK